MSTQTDRTVLANWLEANSPLFPRSLKTLYVGSRDRGALSVVTEYFESVATLDNDPTLKPDYLIDLNLIAGRGERTLTCDPSTYSSLPPRGEYGLVVVPYVLMHLKEPLSVLRRLYERTGGRIVAQENVIRERGQTDPWPDLNRFFCWSLPRYIDETHLRRTTEESGRRLVKLPVKSSYYYANGEGLSGLWEIEFSDGRGDNK